MTDINTVSLSGIVSGDVKISKPRGVSVARFYIETEGAGNPRTVGKFEIVAFAEWAEMTRELSKGDRVVLVGALHEWRGKGMYAFEIHVRRLIPLLPAKIVEADDIEEFREDEIDYEAIDD